MLIAEELIWKKVNVARAFSHEEPQASCIAVGKFGGIFIGNSSLREQNMKAGRNT